MLLHIALNTVSETLKLAALSLRQHSDSPRLDAELLLGKILGLPRSGLIARGNETVTIECEQNYASLIEQRRQGTPVAYLTGTREFWSLTLRVTPAVLVPRPETELLVELALQRLPRERPSSVLDLGTGSGAIALAIASERPRSRIMGVDVSPPALDVALQNSRDLGLSNIEWRRGSWFSAVPGERFDMVVANPPYVAAADPALEKLKAEPAIALCDGPTGLEALSAIAGEAATYLHAGGWLILEHGGDQALEVAGLLERRGFTCICSHLDLSGKPRVTLGTVHSKH
ncbi:MAG TPA: peptide chain release factor N(5)-glutamine methyltransferase [Steroidobacteraceae bacterium]|jgi:release factor glutamine methyltransferase|nr:peptide chain release factor N(5)-glutamine methyltransferase [Steroidobacteraceae bacterium]